MGLHAGLGRPAPHRHPVRKQRRVAGVGKGARMHLSGDGANGATVEAAVVVVAPEREVRIEVQDKGAA